MPASAPWRRAFRRDLTLWLVIKLVALGVLWALCFSPPHRTPVDHGAVERRLAAARSQPVSAVPRPGTSADGTHD